MHTTYRVLCLMSTKMHTLTRSIAIWRAHSVLSALQYTLLLQLLQQLYVVTLRSANAVIACTTAAAAAICKSLCQLMRYLCSACCITVAAMALLYRCIAPASTAAAVLLCVRCLGSVFSTAIIGCCCTTSCCCMTVVCRCYCCQYHCSCCYCCNCTVTAGAVSLFHCVASYCFTVSPAAVPAVSASC
jgi:hypothetical protein